MIPDPVVEVLEGPALIQLGTRDEQLRPAHVIVIGAVVHDDRATVTFFVPAARSERVLRDLRSNGRVALAASIVSHQAYQLKGTYLASRPTSDEDIARQERYRMKALAAVRQIYPDDIAIPVVFGFRYKPGVAITVRIEEVFLQTPGPGAGSRIA